MRTKDKSFSNERYCLKDCIDYGDRFLKVMESRGLTRRVLCEKARVYSGELSSLLNLNRLPTRTTLVKMCKVLQIDPEFFTLPEHSLLELIYNTRKHYCFNYYTDFEIIFGYNPVGYLYNTGRFLPNQYIRKNKKYPNGI